MKWLWVLFRLASIDQARETERTHCGKNPNSNGALTDGWSDQTRLTNRFPRFADWSFKWVVAVPNPTEPGTGAISTRHSTTHGLKKTLYNGKDAHHKHHHVISRIGKQATVSLVSNDDIRSLGQVGQVGQATGPEAERLFSRVPGLQPQLLLTAPSPQKSKRA